MGQFKDKEGRLLVGVIRDKEIEYNTDLKEWGGFFNEGKVTVGSKSIKS